MRYIAYKQELCLIILPGGLTYLNMKQFFSRLTVNIFKTYSFMEPQVVNILILLWNSSNVSNKSKIIVWTGLQLWQIYMLPPA